MYSHVVIAGGTGMLFEASRALAHQCEHLTSIAGTERSLGRLDAAIAEAGCVHHMHALDRSNPREFVRATASRVQAVGDPELVLAWMHDDGLGPLLARALAPTRGSCAFFHVRGSADANPSTPLDALFRPRRLPGGIHYHQVILGFRIENGGSRWLRDDEIVAGVLTAIAGAQSVTVVGTVDPWASHP